MFRPLRCWPVYRLTSAGQRTSYGGAHIRSSAVTLFVGEASAGKTVFLYNLAYYLALGEEFLGLKPPRPLRVLYVDFESGDIMRDNLNAIGNVPGWAIIDAMGEKPGKPLMDRLQETVTAKGYDIVILDPLMEAYPVIDENSNAQANEQMLSFRKLARDTNAAVIVVHNSGQRGLTKASDKHAARGATARVDRADVSINFTSVVGDPTLRTLYVTKSRSSNLNEVIVVKFADELGYELVESTAPSQAAVTEWQAKVVAFVKQQHNAGPFASAVLRGEILKHFKVESGTKESRTLDRALRNCVMDNSLCKPKKGTYAIPSPKELAFDVGQYITWKSPRAGVRSGRILAMVGDWIATNSDSHKGLLEWTHAVDLRPYLMGVRSE